jgi:calcium-dependent protein kinase
MTSITEKMKTMVRKTVQDIIAANNSMTEAQRAQKHEHLISFKSFKGFKKVNDYKKEYLLEKKLSAGAFGTVWSAVHQKSQTACAIKIIKKDKINEASIYKELMMNELKVLEETIHPNITKVFELFEDDKNYFVVCELGSGGCLLEKVKSPDGLGNTSVESIIK